MADADKQKRARISGNVAVILLSILALEIAFLSSGALETMESGMVDARMRWRYHLTVNPENQASKKIILLAIDNKTVEKEGKYGAGKWITRAPFLDQLLKFEALKRKPTVLAYDVMFPNPLQEIQTNRIDVTQSPDKLERIIIELAELARSPKEFITQQALLDLNSLSFELGDQYLTHAFAQIMEEELFDSILGFNFRGGWIDRQKVNVPAWSKAEICGDAVDGDENSGSLIPYLNDIAIPDSDIHFDSDAKKRDYGYSTNAYAPTPALMDYTLMAPLNTPREADGVVRRVPLVVGYEYVNPVTKKTRKVFMPSLSLMASLIHLGVELPLPEKSIEVHFGKEIVIRPEGGEVIRIPIDEKGRMYLNYTAEVNDYDAVSFVHAHAENYQNVINGRIAIVGVVVTGVDVGATPLASNIPLVFIHMTAISNILESNTLAPLSKRAHILLMLLLFSMFTVIGLIEKSAKLGPSSMLFGILYFIAAYSSIHFSWSILPVITPLLYITLASFFILSFRFVVEERAKRRIRGMFSTMVSDKVLSFLEESPDSFSLKGHKAEVSVFFSDIASFTSFSENLEPERLTEFINTYYTPATNCILEMGGFLDKYVGDSIMAVWGAPYKDPDHAVKACHSALEQQVIVKGMQEMLKREYGTVIKVRMGINSGIVAAGNMGSEKKFQYTVMGDAVNFASRLEPANKDFGTDIIIGESTYQLAKNEIVVRPLGKIVVVGKSEIVPIYELVGKIGQVGDERLELISLYEKALSLFYKREWDECHKLTSKLEADYNDVPSTHLKNRIAFFRENEPDDNWQGEYRRSQK